MLARIQTVVILLAFANSVILAGTAAHAQAVRYVASNGANSNNCTRTAPCRTLQRGIERTPNGGELQVLNAGNYGNAVTVDRSITISAVGISATVGSITIDKPGATVVLRGLLLNGRNVPGSMDGIAIVKAAKVQIVGCEIERFPRTGVYFGASNVEALISNSSVRNNGSHGLHLDVATTGTSLTIDNSLFTNNGGIGIFALGPNRATISRAVVSENDSTGIHVSSGFNAVITSTTASNNFSHGITGFGTSTRLTIKRSTASGNGGDGLRVNSGGVAQISQSVFSYNGLAGIRQENTGSVASFGDNNVHDSISGTITKISGI